MKTPPKPCSEGAPTQGDSTSTSTSPDGVDKLRAVLASIDELRAQVAAVLADISGAANDNDPAEVEFARQRLARLRGKRGAP